MQQENQPIGMFPAMTGDAYHAAPGDSSSTIKAVMEKSLLHYWHEYENPDREADDPDQDEEKAAEKAADAKHDLDFGTVIHAAVLEPDTLPGLYVVSPPFNRRTTAGRTERKAFFAAHRDVAVLTEKEVKSVYAIRDRIYKHREIAPLLHGGKAEQSFFARCPRTGALRKCRPDYMHDNGFAILDIKSAATAHPKEFSRDAGKFAYDIGVPWYLDTLSDLYGEAPQHFIFIPIEKEPPYAMGLYYCKPPDIKRARECYQKQWDRLIQARRTNYWPDYAGEQAMPLDLPSYLNR